MIWVRATVNAKNIMREYKTMGIYAKKIWLIAFILTLSISYQIATNAHSKSQMFIAQNTESGMYAQQSISDNTQKMQTDIKTLQNRIQYLEEELSRRIYLLAIVFGLILVAVIVNTVIFQRIKLHSLAIALNDIEIMIENSAVNSGDTKTNGIREQIASIENRISELSDNVNSMDPIVAKIVKRELLKAGKPEMPGDIRNQLDDMNSKISGLSDNLDSIYSRANEVINDELSKISGNNLRVSDNAEKQITDMKKEISILSESVNSMNSKISGIVDGIKLKLEEVNSKTFVSTAKNTKATKQDEIETSIGKEAIVTKDNEPVDSLCNLYNSDIT